MPDIISDAVQPEAWYKDLPRKQYGSFEPVDQPDGWFSVYRLGNGVFAIYEPGHFQEVISFLVTGQKSALLIDTGMGIGNIRSVTDAICPLPVTVVNTHSHFDHIGGNHRYGLVHIFDHPAAVRRLREGLSADELKDNMREGSDAAGYPEGFDPGSYHIKPCNYKVIGSGHTFDLGGRVIEAISTPGHSPDSMMLFDRSNKLLFTGDTVYPATLYAHFDGSDGLASDPVAYRETMMRIADRFAGEYTLLCSHNEPVRPGGMLRDIACAFTAVTAGKQPFLSDENGLKKYIFDGFCIVTG